MKRKRSLRDALMQTAVVITEYSALLIQRISCAKMSGYKLYYFNVRGRAEICRLAFAASNTEFEDIRMTHEEWAKQKACELNK